MPLNAAVLASALRADILSRSEIEGIDSDAMTELCEAIAETVVAHIQANALVTVAAGIPVATATSSGTTIGPGTGTVS